MANKLPCPNPTCTHEFSQAELQAAAQLACPKCGFRMQGRAAAPAPKAARAPTAAKPAPAPLKPAAPAPAPKPVASAPAKTATPIAAQPKPVAAAAGRATDRRAGRGEGHRGGADPNSPKPAALRHRSRTIPLRSTSPPATPSKTAARQRHRSRCKPAASSSDNPGCARRRRWPSRLGEPAATSVASPAAGRHVPVNGEESLPDGAFFNPEVTAATGSLVRRKGSAKKRNSTGCGC